MKQYVQRIVLPDGFGKVEISIMDTLFLGKSNLLILVLKISCGMKIRQVF
jgi:hypothetical protein